MSIPHEDVVGVLLAGGQARRMGGGDKCLLEINGQSLLSRAIDRLSPQVSNLIINANGQEDRFSSFEQPIIKDTIKGFVGPLAGVLAGMRWTRRNAPGSRYIVTAASDTPFFPRDLTARLMKASGKSSSIALAASNGRVHPVFGLWPVSLADHLEEALKSDLRRILDWTDQHEMIEVLFDIPKRDDGLAVDPFFNVNRPEDLARAEKIAEGAS